MSDPKRHHYLPEFYLRRWTTDGKVWRFLRPRGSGSKVHAKQVAPKAVGFRDELYSFPRPERPSDRQSIEKEFLQLIDSRGAFALRKAETNEPATPDDGAALAQFVLSLIHRSPGRIEFLTDQLRMRLGDTADGFPDDFFRHYALHVFSDLASSDLMMEGLTEMSANFINIGEHRHSLMTSDRPTMISNGLHHRDSFVLLPVSPRRLLVLARRSRTPEAFAEQDTGDLIGALNDAVVVQAEALVIGTRSSEKRFVENRLNRMSSHLWGTYSETDGLVRWVAPL